MNVMPKSASILAACIGLSLATGLTGCGGGGGGSASGGAGGSPPAPPPPIPPPPTILDPLYLASAASPFANGCDGVAPDGTLYVNAEVEPYVVVDPTNTQHLVGVWQEDRWLSGGARGIISGLSLDGGKTWSRQPMLFSRCGGGNSVNGGDYPRTSNPWVAIGPTAALYESAISFSGDLLEPGSTSAVLASRSLDGGLSWGNPVTLIHDVDNFFNDRDSISTDPTDPDFVYAVWDRLAVVGGGPATLARSTDGGVTYEPARPIYDPGTQNQTISNEVVALNDGTVLDLFVELDAALGGGTTATIEVIRSTDHGATWSSPIEVASLLSVGTQDPDTGNPVRDASIIPQMEAAPNGELFVVWQDARFTDGTHDAIALAHSSNDGTSWSAPVRVNSDPAVPAFDPSLHVRDDGTIGVTYYDFRNNTTDPSTLPTILWFARSTDAATWHESAIAGPFDLDIAPNSTVSGSPGLFLGDNQGLTSMGSVFEPLFVQTNNGNLNNRTDVFSAPAVSVTTAVSLLSRQVVTTASATPTVYMNAEFRRRVSDNIGNAMESRIPGWHALMRKWRKSNPGTNRQP